MRIALLNGGLGNQVFQYIFVRFAERYAPGETWYFDDSEFFVKDYHNGYELEKVFGVKPNLLSRYFDEDVWAEIIRLRKEEGIWLPQTFVNMGLPLVMVAESNDFSFNGKVMQLPCNQFHPEITKLTDKNIYYHGYWINRDWFASYREEMLEELAFPPLEEERNIRYADMINNSLSVGVHIRRGDFITLKWDLPAEYYNTSCKKILESAADARFFVFSDDITWCQENAEALGLNLAADTVYITSNVKGKNYIDMQLLSMCRMMILSNSSFCYLAALMNKNLLGYVNPTPRKL